MNRIILRLILTFVLKHKQYCRLKLKRSNLFNDLEKYENFKLMLYFRRIFDINCFIAMKKIKNLFFLTDFGGKMSVYK